MSFSELRERWERPSPVRVDAIRSSSFGLPFVLLARNGEVGGTDPR